MAATQTHVHILSTGGAAPLSTPLPEEIQEKPQDIMVEIEGTRAGPIPVPSHDEIDHVWQVRCFSSGVVVLLQNSVLIKGRTGGGEWLHIANLPCIMDAVELSPKTGTLALSHINGDVFVVHAGAPERAPTVMTPRRDAVIARKADANPHMLCAQKRRGTLCTQRAQRVWWMRGGSWTRNKGCCRFSCLGPQVAAVGRAVQGFPASWRARPCRRGLPLAAHAQINLVARLQ